MNLQTVFQDVRNDNDTGYDGTGDGHERCDEDIEDSESEGSDGARSNSSDSSDNDAHTWQTKPSRRNKRKGKRESKFVVFSDPFLSVTKFNSKDAHTTF